MMTQMIAPALRAAFYGPFKVEWVDRGAFWLGMTIG